MCLGNPYGKALANESLRSFLGKTKPTLAEGPQSRIVVPVASERLEGGSVFCFFGVFFATCRHQILYSV